MLTELSRYMSSYENFQLDLEEQLRLKVYDTFLWDNEQKRIVKARDVVGNEIISFNMERLPIERLSTIFLEKGYYYEKNHGVVFLARNYNKSYKISVTQRNTFIYVMRENHMYFSLHKLSEKIIHDCVAEQEKLKEKNKNVRILNKNLVKIRKNETDLYFLNNVLVASREGKRLNNILKDKNIGRMIRRYEAA